MKKSVYSLVLSEEVVRKIDVIAYRKGLSRSQAVNRILAEYVSHETPEQRMETVFHSLARRSENCGTLRFYNLPTASMAYYCGALDYLYRPTVRYSIELYSDASDFLGELKVSFRTKSERLLDELDAFFALWQECEHVYLSDRVRSERARGHYRRLFLCPRDALSADDLGRLITEYVDRLNALMNEYFQAIAAGENAAVYLRKRFSATLNDNVL